ncbi:monoheme cytochrome C [Croceitalea rosinachiae]|uniref:Monoheme cytochrome C n=1 Tax=Croceitalea rosinachiae TaxID=3075596 RepID=A0ABU3A6X3_9FLAO|nr:monoheme cytochrome C [Croceitalea sp. F388]MDT0605933.1 monoheme cytochrome C [Croceitalea sp. F388]
MKNNFQKQVKLLSGVLSIFLVLIFILFVGLFYLKNNPSFLQPELEEELVEISKEENDQIENGIHVQTGFIDDEHMDLVIQNCTSCHSAKLVTQNKMSEEGWKATIKWMQETQNLWDLGPNEAKIVSYLAKNYAPEAKGRRANLEVVEWYELK